MQKYINQLICDFKEAEKNVPPTPVLSEDYEEFEEQMLAIENAPDIPAKKLFGVSYEELPPAEKLTKEQMQQLIEAITDTFEAFNCSVELPGNVPLELQYELVRDQFADPIHYMPGWSMHFDFCSGWCPDCKIIDYCDTKDEIWTKEELDEERRKSGK
jgi:hypothetical protein